MYKLKLQEFNEEMMGSCICFLSIMRMDVLEFIDEFDHCHHDFAKKMLLTNLE